MAERVFLHVGSPKTGTTFLQQVLWSQREEARAQGLLLPLESHFDHFLASLDVRGLSGENARDPRATGMWDRVVAESSAWPGDVLVTHELFAAATAAQAEAALAAFGDCEVHVVLTARDLVRQIPAEWQEHVKHRALTNFPEFVRSLEDDIDGESWFWRVQDYGDVLRRWGHGLEVSRVHLVTVPPAGADPTVLWARFAGLLGLDCARFDLSGRRANTSLGAEQAELLRRVNAELGDRLPIPGPYPGVVKDILAHRVLADRAGTHLSLRGEARAFAARRSADLARDLGDLCIEVVGDLADLVPSEQAVDTDTPGFPVVSEEAVSTESVAALTEMLHRFHKVRERAASANAELTAVREERDRLLHDMRFRPVGHLLVGLSERWPVVMRLRVVYRRVRALTRRTARRLVRRSDRR